MNLRPLLSYYRNVRAADMNDEFSCAEFLAHHGILGQRWGIRRFQNPDGSLTEAGKKRYGSSKAVGIRKHIEKKLKDSKKKHTKPELTEEEKAAKAAKEKEELKDYLRRHPRKMPKYGRQLTEQDVDEIVRNIKFDQKLKDIRKEDIDRGMDKIRTISNNIQTVGNLVKNTTSLYNSTGYVWNALVDNNVVTSDRRMLIIPNNDKKQQ